MSASEIAGEVAFTSDSKASTTTLYSIPIPVIRLLRGGLNCNLDHTGSGSPESGVVLQVVGAGANRRRAESWRSVWPSWDTWVSLLPYSS